MATRQKGKNGKAKAPTPPPDADHDDGDLDFPWLKEQLDRPDAARREPGAPAREEVDPELLQLRPRILWYRPFLILGVMAFAIFIMNKFWPELEYFLSPGEPVAIGDVTEFPRHAAEDPAWAPEIPHNRYVSLEGIPNRVTVSCTPPTRFFKLLGSHIYVEEPLVDQMTTLECERDKEEPDPTKDVEYFTGAGRVLSLDRTGNRYTEFQEFYEANWGELFCPGMTEAKKQKRLDDLRQVLRGQFKERQGRFPTDVELNELLSRERICHNAFIVLADRPPSSNWRYFAIYIALGLVLLWSLYALVRWTLHTVRALR